MNRYRFSTRWFVAAILLLVSPLSMIGEEIDRSDWSAVSERYVGRLPKEWAVNSKYNSGEASIQKTDDGTALKIKVNGDASQAFHIYTRKMVKVAPGSRITVTVSASGQGSLGIVAYVYDVDQQTLGVIPKGEKGMQSVESDAFSEFTYELTLSEQAFRKGTPSQVRLAIIAAPGSEFQVKSLAAKSE